jgi:hypothetical protein
MAFTCRTAADPASPASAEARGHSEQAKSITIAARFMGLW